MTSKFSKLFFLIGLIIILSEFFILSNPVKAADVNELVWGGNTEQAMANIGLPAQDPRIIVINLIRIFLGLLGTIAVVLILYAGFVWMTAGGNEERVEKAKNTLKNAVIGLLLVIASFAIVTFILNSLYNAVSNGSGSEGGSGGYSNVGGLGALGNGIIKSVYPEPLQKNVPRNTGIIVTFREAMDAKTICTDVGSDNKCTSGTMIKADNITLYKTKDGISSKITSVIAASTDNKTFLFKPAEFLGSPSDKVWYTVSLGTGIKKANSDLAFTGLKGFEWQFEVSNILDLEPPKVVSIFPTPDNVKDGLAPADMATAAEALITVKANEQIEVGQVGSCTIAKQFSAATALKFNNVSYNSTSGTACTLSDFSGCSNYEAIIINITNETNAKINYFYNKNNIITGVGDKVENVILDGARITTSGSVCSVLDFTIDGAITVGNGWNIITVQTKPAHQLIIDSKTFNFVSANPGSNDIQKGSDLDTTVANITTKINSANLQVAATSDGNKIRLIAKTAGDNGNNIALGTTAPTSVITWTNFSGGTDQKQKTITMGAKDKYKNAIIQINFNEAINPVLISGKSNDVKDKIRVINLSDGNKIIDGNFVVSNQYKTVEFISSEECGVNGCGEKIYCLPASSKIKVELKAADLAATCPTGTCDAQYVPFSVCTSGICYNSSGLPNPAGKANTGIADLIGNSLDGNKNSKATGPGSNDYNENDLYDSCSVSGVCAWLGNVCTGAGCVQAKTETEAQINGDNYTWSFWISDQLDLTPPKIINTTPIVTTTPIAGVSLNDAIQISFDKALMSSTVATGQIKIKKGTKEVTHKLFNLFNANLVTGYYVTKEDVDTSSPKDSEPDRTDVFIKHTTFNPSATYTAQVGSGVKDIYQNCFKPCASAACPADAANASCCNNVPKAGNSCQ